MGSLGPHLQCATAPSRRGGVALDRVLATAGRRAASAPNEAPRCPEWPAASRPTGPLNSPRRRGSVTSGPAESCLRTAIFTRRGLAVRDWSDSRDAGSTGPCVCYWHDTLTRRQSRFTISIPERGQGHSTGDLVIRLCNQ